MTDAKKGYHGGVTAFLVDSTMKGFQAGKKFDKLGLRTSPTGELAFDDLYVPAESILGTVGGGSVLFTHAMSWERICLFAAHVGTMERLLETSITYARTRTQFGQTIGKFQAVSHRIADMKTQLEAARLLTYQSAWRLGRVRDSSMDASMTKLFVSENLVSAALATVRVHGGYGYDWDGSRALSVCTKHFYSGPLKCNATSSPAGWGCDALWDSQSNKT
jgi:alkylation response protein AidB-like acyl-CoA dehydrogenase